MNYYESKQEAQRVRLSRAADRASAEASRRFEAADLREERSGIPMGQPVLIGHHSARKHMRIIERAEANGRKGVEAYAASKEYQRRADAIGTGGISSDDPDAVQKLKAELETLTRNRAFMVAANKLVKKHYKDQAAGVAAIIALSAEYSYQLSEATAAKMFVNDPGFGMGFMSSTLTNRGASIRRIRKRIDLLMAAHNQAVAVLEGDKEAWEMKTERGTAKDDHTEQRCIIRFSTRLSKEGYTSVRRGGFVWSRTLDAFVRKISNAARYNAERLLSSAE